MCVCVCVVCVCVCAFVCACVCVCVCVCVCNVNNVITLQLERFLSGAPRSRSSTVLLTLDPQFLISSSS